MFNANRANNTNWLAFRYFVLCLVCMRLFLIILGKRVNERDITKTNMLINFYWRAVKQNTVLKNANNTIKQQKQQTR